MSTPAHRAGATAVADAAAPQAVEAPGAGINVSPTHLTPVIAVGDETHEKIVLKNSSGTDLLVRGHVEYGDMPGAGSPSLSLDPEQVRLKSGEEAAITLSIRVPGDAQAGQHRDTARFDVTPIAEGTVSIVSQVAVMVDTGIIRPVDDVNWSSPSLIDPTDTNTFDITGRNAGNFPARLVAEVDISGPFGRHKTLTAVSEETAIGKSGNLQVVWDDPPLIGFGRATLRLSSGVGSPVEKTTYYIIFPWKLASMALLIGAVGLLSARKLPFFAKVFRVYWRKGGNGGR